MSEAPTNAPTVVMVPGWRNSGPGHWQTLWFQRLPGVVRVVQDDWEYPRRTAWVARIGETLETLPGPAVLVAHSLGCIAVAHLEERVLQRVAGALLVAPADPERRGALCDFAPVPHRRLACPSILVASDNDPFCPVRLAGAYARAWGSKFVRVQSGGHINIDSGHGEWPQGLGLLYELLAWGSGSVAAADRSAYAARP